MSTKKTYYPVDIAELYNNGVDHVMKPIWEWDRGTLRVSSSIINGAHFMEQAIVDFMGNYATEYNVVDIRVDNPIDGPRHDYYTK